MTTKKNEKKIIPLRDTLTPDIFAEMEEKYPTTSEKGVEYKQTLSIVGFPADFDFCGMFDNGEDYGNIDTSHALAVYMYLLTLMAESNGYYFKAHNRTAKEIAFTLNLENAEVQDILNFLIEYQYIYNFPTGKISRITSTIAVRSYEIMSSSRLQNRQRKGIPEPKQEPQEQEHIDITNDNDNPPPLPPELEEAIVKMPEPTTEAIEPVEVEFIESPKIDKPDASDELPDISAEDMLFFIDSNF